MNTLEETQNDNLEQELKPKHKSVLGIRAATALCIAAVYVAVVLFSTFSFGPMLNGRYALRFVYDFFVISVTLVCALEMCRAFSHKYAKPLWAFVVFNVVGGYSAFYIIHYAVLDESGGITAFFGVLATTFLLCIVYTMFSKKYSMNNVLTTMLVLIYPTVLFVYMLSLNYLPTESANSAILLLFLLPAFSDTAAYLFGTTFRGPKLAPSISPKKTVSGAVGGVLGGITAGGLVLLLSEFPPGFISIARLSDTLWLNIAHYLIIGAVGAVFIIVGDLIASYIKRQCDVKDFGKLLPGHGGVMDRMDSMILCAVFLYAYFYMFAKFLI